jgi:hypothetical protein
MNEAALQRRSPKPGPIEKEFEAAVRQLCYELGLTDQYIPLVSGKDLLQSSNRSWSDLMVNMMSESLHRPQRQPDLESDSDFSPTPPTIDATMASPQASPLLNGDPFHQPGQSSVDRNMPSPQMSMPPPGSPDLDRTSTRSSYAPSVWSHNTGYAPSTARTTPDIGGMRHPGPMPPPIVMSGPALRGTL